MHLFYIANTKQPLRARLKVGNKIYSDDVIVKIKCYIIWNMENNCVENKIWLQQENESDKMYKRFLDFLNYEAGNLKKYIEERGTSFCGLTKYSLEKLATQYDWRARKNAFLNHHQQIISSATDNAIYTSIYSECMNSLETTFKKMFDLALRSINDKIEKETIRFQEGKEFEDFNKVLTMMDKLISMRQDMGDTVAGHFPTPNSLEIMSGVLIEGFISKNSSLEVASLASAIDSEQINSLENKNLMDKNE